uniref:Srp40 C-terminal domain-containing protein n=1 Tax=Setaria digitata TaxID=48799 RepID=A0A915PXK6_9BILA
MEESPAVDFDVLFYDHLIKEEPKLVNRVFSAQRRDELEKRRRSSGNFKPLKDVVLEYNKIVCRKRNANGIIDSPVAKKVLRQDPNKSLDSDYPIKQIAAKLVSNAEIKQLRVPGSSVGPDSDISKNKSIGLVNEPNNGISSSSSDSSASDKDDGKMSMVGYNFWVFVKTGSKQLISKANTTPQTKFFSSSLGLVDVINKKAKTREPHFSTVVEKNSSPNFSKSLSPDSQAKELRRAIKCRKSVVNSTGKNKIHSSSSSNDSDEAVKVGHRAASSAKQTTMIKEGSESSSSDDDVQGKAVGSIPGKMLSEKSNISLTKNAAAGGKPSRNSSSSTSSSDDDDDNIGGNLKKKAFRKVIPAVSNIKLKNNATSARKPRSSVSDSSSSSNEDDGNINSKENIPRKAIPSASNINSKNGAPAIKPAESSSDSSSSNDDVNMSPREKTPKKESPAVPSANLKGSTLGRKVSANSSDSTSSSGYDGVNVNLKEKILKKAVPAMSNVRNTALARRSPGSSSDSTSSSEGDIDVNLKAKTSKRMNLAASNASVKSTASAPKLPESSSDSTSSSEDDGDISAKEKLPKKTAAAMSKVDLKNLIPANEPSRSSSDSISSSDDSDGDVNLKEKTFKKAVPVMLDANLKNLTPGKLPDSSSDSTSSSTDGDVGMNLGGKTRKKLISNAKSKKDSTPASKLSGNSSDTTSSGDDVNGNLKLVIQEEVPKKVLIMPNFDLKKNTSVLRKVSESSSDSISSSDDDAEDHQSLVKGSTSEYFAVERSESFKDNISLSKKIPETLTKVSRTAAISVRNVQDTEDSDSDSESANGEIPAKKPKLQVQQDAQIARKEGFDTNSSDSSDNSSGNTTNTGQKKVVALDGKVKSSTVKRSSSSSSNSDDSDSRRAKQRISTVKVIGTKTIANENTSSSDSDSDSGSEKAQTATATEQSKKPTQPAISRSKMKSNPSFSDSSSDSGTISVSGKTAQKQQSASKLQYQEKVNGNQKVRDHNISGDAETRGATPEVTPVHIELPIKNVEESSSESTSSSDEADASPLKHSGQKVAVKSLVNSKLSIGRDSDTSSDSDFNEVAKTDSKGPQRKTEPMIVSRKNTGTFTHKDSTSSDSSSESDAVTEKGNIKSFFKQVNSGITCGDIPTKQTLTKHRKTAFEKDSGKMDCDSSSDSSESNTNDAVVLKKRNFHPVRKEMDQSLPDDADSDNSGRMAECNVRKTMDMLKEGIKKKQGWKEDASTDLKKGGNGLKNMGSDQNIFGKSGKKQQVVKNEPFHRVKTSKDELDDRFRDNSYRAKTYDHWGKKAYEDLRNVQGKGFRHEKTKKKRGSYSGGGTKIDTSSHSIKFDSDSD